MMYKANEKGYTFSDDGFSECPNKWPNLITCSNLVVKIEYVTKLLQPNPDPCPKCPQVCYSEQIVSIIKIQPPSPFLVVYHKWFWMSKILGGSSPPIQRVKPVEFDLVDDDKKAKN
jgi:hypothetical protein